MIWMPKTMVQLAFRMAPYLREPPFSARPSQNSMQVWKSNHRTRTLWIILHFLCDLQLQVQGCSCSFCCWLLIDVLIVVIVVVSNVVPNNYCLITVAIVVIVRLVVVIALLIFLSLLVAQWCWSFPTPLLPTGHRRCPWLWPCLMGGVRRR